jgi:hypothetical protein
MYDIEIILMVVWYPLFNLYYFIFYVSWITAIDGIVTLIYGIIGDLYLLILLNSIQ